MNSALMNTSPPAPVAPKHWIRTDPAAAPPKWKMALLNIIGLYPLILLVPKLLGPTVAGWPLWLNTIATLAVIVPIVTWGVMPLLTWAFKRWLYPAPPVPPTVFKP